MVTYMVTGASVRHQAYPSEEKAEEKESE